VPPNGLPFSRRERTADALQKANDLAREAVGWNGVLARSGLFLVTQETLVF
jgi:hypothetical protein